MKKRLIRPQIQIPQFSPENNVAPTRRRSATNPRQFSKSWLEAVKLSPFNMMASTFGGDGGDGGNDNSRSGNCCNHGLYIKPDKYSGTDQDEGSYVDDDVKLIAGIYWDVATGYVCSDGGEDYWSYLNVHVSYGGLIAPLVDESAPASLGTGLDTIQVGFTTCCRERIAFACRITEVGKCLPWSVHSETRLAWAMVPCSQLILGGREQPGISREKKCVG